MDQNVEQLEEKTEKIKKDLRSRWEKNKTWLKPALTAIGIGVAAYVGARLGAEKGAENILLRVYIRRADAEHFDGTEVEYQTSAE